MREQLNEQKQRSMRRDRALGVTMLVLGLAITGLALNQMRPQAMQHAQSVPQTSPSAGPPAPLPPAPAEKSAPPIERK